MKINRAQLRRLILREQRRLLSEADDDCQSMIRDLRGDMSFATSGDQRSYLITDPKDPCYEAFKGEFGDEFPDIYDDDSGTAINEGRVRLTRSQLKRLISNLR